jgi:hypothetical protein
LRGFALQALSQRQAQSQMAAGLFVVPLAQFAILFAQIAIVLFRELHTQRKSRMPQQTVFQKLIYFHKCRIG